MPEWLLPAIANEATLSPAVMLLRMVLAVLYGGGVAGIYRCSHGRLKDDATILVATLVLLSVLIAMVSMVIGDSVALAFSLVGALSIVRFRTVVDDTRDTAFVIFAVIVGMSAGAGLLLLPLLGLPLVGATALALSHWVPITNGRELGATSSLQIRIGLGRDPEQLLGGILQRHATQFRLTSAATARQGAALDLHYQLQLSTTSSLAALVAELNQVDGVQTVELRA